MISRGTRRRSTAAVSAASIVLLVSGCGSSSDDATPGGDVTGTSSASGSDSGSDSASEAPSEAPSSSVPTPTSAVIEPAGGGLVKVPGASMHALETYKHLNDFGIVQGWNDGQSAMTFSPSLSPKKSLDGFAREWISEHGGKKVQVRVEDAVAGGKYSAWHVVDTTSDPTEIAHTFGIRFLDSAWLIDITMYLPGYPDTLTEEEQQEVIDRLLASFKTDLD